MIWCDLYGLPGCWVPGSGRHCLFDDIVILSGVASQKKNLKRNASQEVLEFVVAGKGNPIAVFVVWHYELGLFPEVLLGLRRHFEENQRSNASDRLCSAWKGFWNTQQIGRLKYCKWHYEHFKVAAWVLTNTGAFWLPHCTLMGCGGSVCVVSEGLGKKGSKEDLVQKLIVFQQDISVNTFWVIRWIQGRPD